MTYLPVGILLPHLTGLKEELTPEIGTENYRSVVLQLEMLPYAFGATESALHHCVGVQKEILAETVDKGLGQGITVLSPEQRDRLGFPIDSFLESARRTQNALVPYLRRAFSRKFNEDLSKFVKDIEAKRASLGEVLDEVVVGYWTCHGGRLKDYRDASQHSAIVSSDARVFWSQDGRLALYLLLPTNPEVKSASKLEYGKPMIHAYPYVIEQFKKLYEIVYIVTRYLADMFPGQVNPDGTMTVRRTPVLPRDPITLGKGATIAGHPAIDHDEVRVNLERQVPRVNEIYCRLFPPGG